MSDIPAHVMRSFLAPLAAVLGDPVSPDPQRFMAEFGRHLRNYTAAELAPAADAIVRSHKGPARWPKLSECIDACEAERERQQVTRKPSRQEISWRRRAANAERLMMETDLGQRAARDGWANGCREFIVAKGRLPHDHEVHDLIESADYSARCAAGTVAMGICHSALVGLANKICDRRDAIADRVINHIEIELRPGE